MEKETEIKETEKKKAGWGGARKGSGRPRSANNAGTVTINIPADVAEVLSRQTNRTAYIIEAIRFYETNRDK